MSYKTACVCDVCGKSDVDNMKFRLIYGNFGIPNDMCKMGGLYGGKISHGKQVGNRLYYIEDADITVSETLLCLDCLVRNPLK